MPDSRYISVSDSMKFHTDHTALLNFNLFKISSFVFVLFFYSRYQNRELYKLKKGKLIKQMDR